MEKQVVVAAIHSGKNATLPNKKSRIRAGFLVATQRSYTQAQLFDGPPELSWLDPLQSRH